MTHLTLILTLAAHALAAPWWDDHPTTVQPSDPEAALASRPRGEPETLQAHMEGKSLRIDALEVDDYASVVVQGVELAP